MCPVIIFPINSKENNGLSHGKLFAGIPTDWQEQKKLFGVKQESAYA